MTPTEDEMDKLTDIICRLRAENARMREAGQAVVDDWANAEVFHEVVFEKLVNALRAALKEGGGE